MVVRSQIFRMPLSSMVPITQGNISVEVLQSIAPVLVFFWAEWCVPCKTVTRHLDELADRYQDRVKIGSVNIEEQEELTAEYGVRAVPTLLLLQEGRIVGQFVGPSSKYELADSLDQVRAC